MARGNLPRCCARRSPPGSLSPTIKDAAALWIKRCNEKRLESTTVKGYEEHVDLHIVPFIGAKKLSELTVPAVNVFADRLRDAGRSGEMIKRVVRSLGAIFKEAVGADYRTSIRLLASNLICQIGQILARSFRRRANSRPSLPAQPGAGDR
jgi:hypothetical protein